MTLRASPAMMRAAEQDKAAVRVDHARHNDRARAVMADAEARAARIVAIPCPDEEGAKLILRCMAREVHARIVLIEGQHEADTLFASIARKGADVPRRRDTGAAERERVFGKAANDDGEAA